MNRQLRHIKKGKENDIVAISHNGDVLLEEAINVDNASKAKSAGVPKGTTLDAATGNDHCKRKAASDASLMYGEARSEAKVKGIRLSHGYLEIIIRKVLADSSLAITEPNFFIPHNTVRSCVKRGADLTKSSLGVVSPLALVEPYLVSIFMHKARIGQQMGMTEGFEMIKSMIKGTTHQVKLVNLKKRLKCKQDKPGLATLGTSYWRNFWKRHSHVLDADTSVSQALCRKEWRTYQNFYIMYTLVYAVMEEA